jgi:hypothetical protein
MAQHEASTPAPVEPAHAASEVFGSGNAPAFNPVVPEQVSETPSVTEVPSPLTAPETAPATSSPPPEWQTAFAQLQAQAAQERQAFLETLRGFAPKPEPVQEVEPDYLAMLPPEMRNEANLPTAKVMWQMAKQQADAVRAEYAKEKQAQTFQGQVQQAHQSAQAVVQRIGAKGFDFSVPGGDKATAGLETVAKAFAARWGGDPSQYETQILEIADSLARARIGGQVAANKARLSQQAPAGRVPAMTGAPGTSPAQLPGAKKAIPSEAEARAQGYASITDWYSKNM